MPPMPTKNPPGVVTLWRMSVGEFERFREPRVLRRENVAFAEVLQKAEAEHAHDCQERENTSEERPEREARRRIFRNDDDEEIQELHEQNPGSAEDDPAALFQPLEEERHEHEEEPSEDQEPAQPV